MMTPEEKTKVDEILTTKPVEVLHLQPADVLVIVIKGQRISDATKEYLVERFKEMLHPSVAVVLEGDIEFGVIRRSAFQE